MSDDELRAPPEDRWCVSFEWADVLVQRLFAASLDLNTALTIIEDDRGAARVRHAIGGLDHAINDVRQAVVTPGWSTPAHGC